MSYSIYLDESGQTANTTPYAVFGGFGIEKAKEPSFIDAFKALYKECFGIAYEESYDLKGKSLFEKKKVKWALSLPTFTDDERQNYAAQFRSTSPNAGYIHEGRAAYGQACLKFADDVFKLLANYQCAFFCSLTPFGINVPLRDPSIITKLQKTSLTSSDENYVTTLIKELEILIYEDIIKYCYLVNMTECIINVDDSENGKSTGLREKFFKSTYRVFQNEELIHNRQSITEFTFNVINSNQSLFIQIADIICYVVNWGYNTDSQLINFPNRNNEIVKIYQKYGTSFINENHLLKNFKLQRLTTTQEKLKNLSLSKRKPQSEL